jgi:hypothetical protein
VKQQEQAEKRRQVHPEAPAAVGVTIRGQMAALDVQLRDETRKTPACAAAWSRFASGSQAPLIAAGHNTVSVISILAKDSS